MTIPGDGDTYESDRAGHDLLDLSVAAKQESTMFVGWVYCGTEVIYECTMPTSAFPAGIEDFAAIVARRFASKLRLLLTD